MMTPPQARALTSEPPQALPRLDVSVWYLPCSSPPWLSAPNRLDFKNLLSMLG